jgi:hypothetical protein
MEGTELGRLAAPIASVARFIGLDLRTGCLNELIKATSALQFIHCMYECTTFNEKEIALENLVH